MLPGDRQYIMDGLDRLVPGQYELLVPEEYDEETLCSMVSGVQVLLGPFVSERLLGNATELKLIQVPWTGMDTFRFAAVRNSNVPICNTHGNAEAVAELGIALTLDLLKKVSYHDRKMRRGNWNRDQKPLNLKSGMLCEKTVCILGLGNIGGRIAELAHAFGAAVIGTSDRRTSDEIVNKVYPQSSLTEAAAEADILICTLPLTEHTKAVIDRDFLEKMKKGSLLVNMSRAAVIDEDALYASLISGMLGGFAADVWWNAPKRGESESYPSLHNPFWELENVVLSPHRAGFAENGLPHLDGAIENIAALIQGKPLQSVVNKDREY